MTEKRRDTRSNTHRHDTRSNTHHRTRSKVSTYRRKGGQDRFYQAVYVISVAAELAGVHPQTLRGYERRGLLAPTRTAGGSRRYSDADLARLKRILTLTNEGLNIAGVLRVLELEKKVQELQRQVTEQQQQIILWKRSASN